MIWVDWTGEARPKGEICHLNKLARGETGDSHRQEGNYNPVSKPVHMTYGLEEQNQQAKDFDY